MLKHFQKLFKHLFQQQLREIKSMKPAKLDFKKINQEAMALFATLVRRWLPNGSLVGREWVPCNPTRNDRTPGSFFINLDNGCFYDFATSEGGRGAIALYAYINKVSYYEAAKFLVKELHYNSEKKGGGNA